jgi:MFS family permease
MRGFPSYQQGLALLLGLVGGLVLFDRNAINFLSPFIVAELKLNNAELGVASSVVALTWASAGYLVGRWSDRAGRRKPYYVAAIIAFSLCSMASGLAGGFLGLILTRLAMGAAEGPTPILGIAMIMRASAPSRRGLNMGILSVTGVLLGGALAPLVLVSLATHLGWRAAFFVTGIPGLLAALAVAKFVREAPEVDTAETSARPRDKRYGFDVLRVRNVWLCGVISSLLVAGNTVAIVFTPVFLVGPRHLTPTDMGIVMSSFGFASMAGALILPAVSDRLGRKPILLGFATFTPLHSVRSTGLGRRLPSPRPWRPPASVRFSPSSVSASSRAKASQTVTGGPHWAWRWGRQRSSAALRHQRWPALPLIAWARASFQRLPPAAAWRAASCHSRSTRAHRNGSALPRESRRRHWFLPNDFIRRHEHDDPFHDRLAGQNPRAETPIDGFHALEQFCLPR